MSNLVELGFQYFNDPDRSRAIWNGYIYVGEPNTDPADIPSNLKAIEVRTADGNTLSVNQPLRTNSGGNPEYNGEPVQILTEGNYSLLVQDKLQRDKFYLRNSLSGSPEASEDLTELVSIESLQVGEVYSVLGGLTKGDRGDAKWLCTSTNTNETSLVSATDQVLGSTTVKWLDGILYTPTSVASIWNALECAEPVVNVIMFGANPDGTYNSTIAIQQAVNFVSRNAQQPTGGGQLNFPRGIYRTDKAIQVYSDLRIQGESWTSTYIKPLDSATFSANEAVIQSLDFPTVQGTNQWDYYSPYPVGLVMGFGIDGITIDGNRDNVANAGGLNIYGGKWTFGTIGVINTDSHAIWTECGVPNTSTAGDDFHDWLNMHECHGDTVFISNANQHGWLYRGANDSYINDIQIKTCGWAGFFQESTGDNSVGNLEVASLHAYSCNCDHDANGAIIELASANAQFVYVDASLKNGLRTSTSGIIIDQVLILKNNSSNAGAFWGVILDVATQINMIRNAETTARTSGTNAGVLQSNIEGSIIGQIRSTQAAGTTIPETVVELNAATKVGKIVASSYDTGGSVLEVNSPRCEADVDANNCTTAVIYNTSGRNRININALNCTTDILYNVIASNTDQILLQSNNVSRAELTIGKIISAAKNREISTVSPAASLTPDLSSQSTIRMIGLNQNLTVNAPVNGTSGDELEFAFQQDVTGGRTITFDAAFNSDYTDTGNTASQRLWIKFLFDGASWVMTANTGWY